MVSLDLKTCGLEEEVICPHILNSHSHSTRGNTEESQVHRNYEIPLSTIDSLCSRGKE